MPSTRSLLLLLALALAACSSAPPAAKTGAPAASAGAAGTPQSPFLMDALRARMQAPRAVSKTQPTLAQGTSVSQHEPVVPPSAALMASLQPDAGDNERAAMLTQAAHAEDAQRAPLQPVVPPAFSDAYDRAIEAARQGQYPQALQGFENLAAHQPFYSGPWVNEGLIYLHQKRYDEAQKVLHTAISINDANPYAWDALGTALRHLGHFEEARHAYQRALQLDNNYARAHFNYAVLAELYLQDLPLALRHYMRYQALQIQPDPAVARWIVDLKRRTGYKESTPTATPAVTPTATPAGAATTPVQGASS